MKNYTFQEWQRFFGLKKNFPADLNTMESTTPKELDKKKAIKGEKNPGNALAKDDIGRRKRYYTDEEWENREPDPAISEASKRGWANRKERERLEAEIANLYPDNRGQRESKKLERRFRRAKAKRDAERDKENYAKMKPFKRDNIDPELKEAIDSVLTEPQTPEPKPTPIATPTPKGTEGSTVPIRELATSSDKADRLNAYQSLESRAYKFSPNSKKMNQLKTLREEFSSDDIAKEVAMELNKLLKASNIKIVNWGIYGNIGGGKGHKPPEAKMGHPTNKNKRHHTPHTGTGGNVQEGDDGGE